MLLCVGIMTLSRKKILIIQNLALNLSRSISRGVFNYIRVNRLNWRPILLDMSWNQGPRPYEFQYWDDISGAIVAITSEEQLSEFKCPTKFPMVNTYAEEKLPVFPQVDTNGYQAGKMAAEYFVQKGFSSFIYIETPYSKRRRQGFSRTLNAAGCRCEVFQLPIADDPNINDLLKIVSHAPKPIAMYCEYDQIAFRVIPHLEAAGFHIPHDIAILGTQNDEMICESARPYISSVKLPYKEVGYEAARILDNLMKGKPAPPHPVRLDPVAVIERQSTDILAVQDPQIKYAIHYIHTHAFGPIKVNDIARSCGVSLRILQRNFRDTLGYSLQKEIQRTRIVHAKELLRNTTLSLDDITERVGFSQKSYLGAAFRATTGMSPGKFRDQCQH